MSNYNKWAAAEQQEQSAFHLRAIERIAHLQPLPGQVFQQPSPLPAPSRKKLLLFDL